MCAKSIYYTTARKYSAMIYVYVDLMLDGKICFPCSKRKFYTVKKKEGQYNRLIKPQPRSCV